MGNRIIEFIRTKDFKFIKDVGQGGTGKTVLLKDELIDELFVCKKYSPYDERHKDTYFKNFVDEIKILHKLYHKNVVRVFNYYLYPERKTGYILMEYIEGQNIDEYLQENPHRLNDIFVQTINGFNYLESNGILHRDIRPENILVSDTGFVKIIDFGFGKKINYDDDFDKSITLNWRFTPPKDFKEQIYDFRTEIYFIGRLFEEIIVENKIENFSYSNILKSMTEVEYDERINSFSIIGRNILSNETDSLEFQEEDKIIYQNFANGLISIFSKIEQETDYIKNIDKIVLGLESVYRNSILEDIIQNPNSIASCFVNGNYRYYKKIEILVSTLRDFLKLFNSVSIDKKHIILNNLWQRLDTVQRFIDDDDLPF
ncbi:MAG TPA: protein kinase family protein [Ignavibacteria bacterium]|nr:protein kinase family protein [Ignavibacteria bacterium]